MLIKITSDGTDLIVLLLIVSSLHRTMIPASGIGVDEVAGSGGGRGRSGDRDEGRLLIWVTGERVVVVGVGRTRRENWENNGKINDR